MYTDPAQSAFGGASTPASPNQNSYVDEYTPPAQTANTPFTGATNPSPVGPTTSSAPATSSASASAQAALDELEKLLAEIKAKNDSLQTSRPAGGAPTMTTPVMGAPASPTPTPTFNPVSTPAWEPKDPVGPDVPLTRPQTDMVPPAMTPPMSTPAMDVADQSSTDSESLEEQNIFYLLGVTDGTDEQKESFLDELQQTIWEDFVDHDVKLLLTNEEYTAFEQEKVSSGGSSPAAQEKLMAWLEAKIPDLEDILLEKALELKADMVRERIAGLREYHAGKSDVLAQLDRADQLTTQSKWHSAATLLNSLPK